MSKTINLSFEQGEFLEDLSRLTGRETAELETELFESVEGEELKLKEGVNIFGLVKDGRKALIERNKKERKDQYNRGLKEGAGKFEKTIRSLGEFDTDLQGVDLLNAFVEVQKSTTGDDITEEFLAKHSVANQWLNSKLAKSKEAFKAVEDDFKAKLDKITRERKAEKIDSMAFDWLETNNWNDGEGDIKKSRRSAIRRLLDYDRIAIEDGKPVLLDENGAPARDNLEHPIKWTDHLKEIGDAVGGFNKVKPTSTPPSPGSSGESNNKLKVESKQQFDAHMVEVQAMRDKGQHQKAAKFSAEVRRAYAEYLDSQK